MIKSTLNTGQEPPALELTPLIDIVFIIIVFLLITANAPLLKLPVNIPEAVEQSAVSLAEPDSLVITIQQQSPIWAIDEVTYTSWRSFETSLLSKISSGQRISIATDKQADAENLVKVMSLLNAQAMENVQIVMSQSE
ncbi:biopolymer transporter ExbD [Litoribacillus peritrichatus]|uniref:Biopolymer transporter ExbD n=1 Tax=Litoribacillus peritrichatus TaxID=718191 RepID=A0ABP7MH60_9GAMM